MQRRRRIVVQEDSHPLLRTQRFSQASGSVLQNKVHLLTRDSRKPLDELLYGGASLDVGKKRRDRHTSSTEYPGAAQLLWISFYSAASSPIEHQFHYAPSGMILG